MYELKSAILSRHFQHFITFKAKIFSRSAILVLVLILFTSVSLLSQGNAGRILGTIADQTGGIVPGATVTITDTQRGVSRTLTTDEAGEYNAPNLIPGSYTVEAAAKGFKTTNRPGVTLEVGGEIRIDLTLQAGESIESITVTDSVPLLETTNAEQGGTIQNEQINDLPLNGRNYQNLLTLRPGVTIYPGGGGWTQSTNGLRAHDNIYMVDGIVNSDPYMGQSIYNAPMAAGDAGTIFSIDAIDEFKTEQNPRAEFGWKPGSIVNIGVKSGTNSIHGTAFAYGRDAAWDALNYFTPPASSPTCQLKASTCSPPLAVEQFGATVGGPIKHDKLFYFADFEDQRYTVGSTFVTNSPIVTPGVGTASSNLIAACDAALSTTGVSALSAKLAGLSTSCVPLSNYPGLFPDNTSTQGFPAGLSNTNGIDSGLAKLDYHLNDHQSFSGSYFISEGSGIFNDSGAQVAPQWQTNQFAHAQVGAADWTWTPNSQWVNEGRFGYSHYEQGFESVDHNVPATTYGLNTGVTNPVYGGLPQIQFNSLGPPNFQLGANWPKLIGPDHVLNLLDHVSYLRGKHAFKFGFEFIGNSSNSVDTFDAKGPIRFGDLTGFFQGVPLHGTILVGNANRTFTSQGYAAFAQDDWRITPRVTVNLGLRYELDTVLKEKDNLIGNFSPTVGLEQVGKQISSPFNGDHNNFAPRLGVAWDIQGNGKTVVRAGAGIIYEQLSYDVYNSLGDLLGLKAVPTGAILESNGTGVGVAGGGNIALAAITVSGPNPATPNNPTPSQLNWNGSSVGGATIYPTSTLQVTCGTGTGLDASPCTAAGADPNLRTPYVTNWSLDVQRSITNSMSLDIAYVGNHGTKLVQYVDENAPPVGAGYSAAEIAWCNANSAFAASPLYSCDPSDASGALEQAARPFTVNGKFPYLSWIYYLKNADDSNYNGAQITLTQRTSHGLSFLAGYTYSHAFDDICDNWACGQGLPLANNAKALYASSDWDIRNRFTLSITYSLPSIKAPGQLLQGWQINSIVTVQSGQPWYPQDMGNDFSGTGIINASNGHGEQWDFFGNPSDFTSSQNNFSCWSGSGPSALPGCNIPSLAPPAACTKAATALGVGTMNSLLNVGCFVSSNGKSALIAPAIGSIGNANRNLFQGPAYHNWDFSITKAWKFQDRLSAQFRAEFFNILNHPNFTNPEGAPNGFGNNNPATGPGFGCSCVTPDVAASNPVLGSGGPRAMQLGLKLLF